MFGTKSRAFQMIGGAVTCVTVNDRARGVRATVAAPGHMTAAQVVRGVDATFIDATMVAFDHGHTDIGTFNFVPTATFNRWAQRID